MITDLNHITIAVSDVKRSIEIHMKNWSGYERRLAGQMLKNTTENIAS